MSILKDDGNRIHIVDKKDEPINFVYQNLTIEDFIFKLNKKSHTSTVSSTISQFQKEQIKSSIKYYERKFGRKLTHIEIKKIKWTKLHQVDKTKIVKLEDKKKEEKRDIDFVY